MMKKQITGLLFLFILITGCLTTPEPEQPIRVELLFQVEELGELFEFEEDSLVVHEFKFAVDRFSLFGEDDLELGSSDRVDSMIFFYREDMSNKNLVLGVNLGFQDVDRFDGYEMFLRPVEVNSNIDDRDFFGSEETYSFVAIGEFNGEEFIYNSSLSFDKFQEFSTIQVSQDSETLIIDKSIVVSDIFIDDSEQRIIDPTDPDNESLINNNFEENLKIEGYSLTRFVDVD